MINRNRKYSVSDPDTLRKACIDSGWFTDGTVSQYEKLFYANENRWPIALLPALYCMQGIVEALGDSK